MENRKVRLAGVWQHTTDTGEVYWKGKINDFLSICIFKRDKENENAPDMDVVLLQKGGK